MGTSFRSVQSSCGRENLWSGSRSSSSRTAGRAPTRWAASSRSDRVSGPPVNAAPIWSITSTRVTVALTVLVKELLPDISGLRSRRCDWAGLASGPSCEDPPGLQNVTLQLDGTPALGPGTRGAPSEAKPTGGSHGDGDGLGLLVGPALASLGRRPGPPPRRPSRERPRAGGTA